jgi:CheY-like chemotaxis protein
MQTCPQAILVVDDEPVVLKFCSTVLVRAGYDVLTAPDGASAMEICRNAGRPINLALLDVIMHGMSGPELADCLGGMGVARIVLMSGFPEKELLRQLGYELPKPRRFITKPFTSEILLQTVREFLAQSTTA